MNTFDASGRESVGERKTSRRTWLVYACLLSSVAVGAGGCVEPYAAPPATYAAGYAPAPAYGAPGYVAPASSISVEIGDRPYYTRGPGYYVGRAYYVWRPGHWSRRQGQRVWIHGHYVVR